MGQLKYLALSGLFVGDKEAKTDVLLVGRVNRKKISVLINKFQGTFSREINYTVMSPSEYKYRKDITDRFLYELLENKKIVIVDKLKKEDKK